MSRGAQPGVLPLLRAAGSAAVVKDFKGSSSLLILAAFQRCPCSRGSHLLGELGGPCPQAGPGPLTPTSLPWGPAHTAPQLLGVSWCQPALGAVNDPGGEAEGRQAQVSLRCFPEWAVTAGWAAGLPSVSVEWTGILGEDGCELEVLKVRTVAWAVQASAGTSAVSHPKEQRSVTQNRGQAATVAGTSLSGAVGLRNRKQRPGGGLQQPHTEAQGRKGGRV